MGLLKYFSQCFSVLTRNLKEGNLEVQRYPSIHASLLLYSCSQDFILKVVIVSWPCYCKSLPGQTSGQCFFDYKSDFQLLSMFV